jgi:hypothetical protein
MLLGWLAGCSSSGLAPTSVGSGNMPPAPTRFGQLNLSIQWPDGTRAIPVGTDQIFIRITGEGIYMNPMAPNGWDGFTVSVPKGVQPDPIEVPAGQKVIVISALGPQGMDGDRELLAYGQAVVTVTSGANPVTITLAAFSAGDQKILDAITAMNDAPEPTSYAEIKSLAQTVLTNATAAITLDTAGRAGQQGRMMAAVATLAIAGCELAIAWDAPFDSGGGGSTVPITPPMQASSRALLLTPDVASSSVALSYLLTNPGQALSAVNVAGALTSTLRSPSEMTSPTRQEEAEWELPAPGIVISNVRATLLPAIATARDYLAALNLATPLGMPMPPDEDALTFDQGDKHLLLAVIDCLSAIIYQASAYDVTGLESFNFDKMPAEYDANSNGLITPAEYLPPAPFGTLKATGAADLLSAQAKYQSTLDNMVTGMSLHLARPWQASECGELFMVEPSVYWEWWWGFGQVRYQDNIADYSMIRDVAKEVRQAFSGPYTLSPTFTGMDNDMPVNLSRLFVNPITDVRAVLPTFTLLAPGGTVIMPGGYPDATFNGIVPGGFPTTVLYPTNETDMWIW